MKQPILVLRTVSVEKLSPVLNACREQWKGHPIWVVSNVGRGRELARDERIAQVVSYEGGGDGFGQPLEISWSFAAVVLPVANEGGSGYGNVMRACEGLDSASFYLCSRCRELVISSRFEFWIRGRVEKLIERVAHVLVRVWVKSFM